MGSRSKYLLQFKDPSGQIVVSPRNYYDRYIHLHNQTFVDNRMIICPFHDDINPSMGTFYSKDMPGVELFHCFGCGLTGDAIKMHQLWQKKLGRYVSYSQATTEVANLYSIELPTSEAIGLLGDLENRSNELNAAINSNKMSLAEYSSRLTELKNDTSLSIPERLEFIEDLVQEWKEANAVTGWHGGTKTFADEDDYYG